ncbi:MAG TPA: heme-binding protein [Coleofasciculaceae cyanobacterium]
MEKLTAEQVTQIIEIIRQQAEMENCRFSIAVADAAGHLAGFLRMDGALLASVEVSQVKARTAVLFGTATKNLPWNTPLAGPMADGVSFPIALLPGGIPIYVNGQLIGGIGVGGATGEQDDAAAQAGLSVFSESVFSESVNR